MQRPTSSLRPESSLFLQSAVDDDGVHADANDGDHYHSQWIIKGILILMIATLIVMLVIHIFADSDIVAADDRGG